MRIPWLVTGAVVLGSAHAAHAGKVSAEVLCGVTDGGEVEVVVPTPDGRKLDKPITCAIHLDAAPAGKTLIAQVVTSADGAMKHSGPITPDADFTQVLAPGDDFAACASFAITARVTSDAGATLWESKLSVKQTCPAQAKPAPPAARKPPPSEPPPAEDEFIGFAEGELERAPADAHDALVDWAASYSAQDHVFFETFPKAGVRVGKVTVTMKNMNKLVAKAGGIYQVLTILPRFRCQSADDIGTHPEHCHWSMWHTAFMSKTEIWAYNSDPDDYGPWQAAVFKKKGRTWVWVAVKTYTQG
ncbi:MAG: hypothetical protein K8W52_28555 [Deltaproteobacteria bacterium]|nr:hypothetical protein [Deltaproteobacteria bacterium]